ncbi:MAG: hypothetical protein U0575_06645 [Phycisphaerales bacterium]|jgi:hypothetical protein
MSTKSTQNAGRGGGERPVRPDEREEMVRYRAYEIYLARVASGASGDAHSDWFQAAGDIDRTEDRRITTTDTPMPKRTSSARRQGAHRHGDSQ